MRRIKQRETASRRSGTVVDFGVHERRINARGVQESSKQAELADVRYRMPFVPVGTLPSMSSIVLLDANVAVDLPLVDGTVVFELASSVDVVFDVKGRASLPAAPGVYSTVGGVFKSAGTTGKLYGSGLRSISVISASAGIVCLSCWGKIL